MATRSIIGVMHGDVCKAVYCHWDGYLDHNGAILQEHYDSVKANHLVSLGDISSLGQEIGEAHPFSQFEINKDDPDFDKLIALHELADKEGWTTFYGRDRGETDVGHKVFHSYDDFVDFFNRCGAEYAYIMNQGTWYVKQYSGELEILADVLAKNQG